jgi:hypothetical protein
VKEHLIKAKIQTSQSRGKLASMGADPEAVQEAEQLVVVVVAAVEEEAEEEAAVAAVNLEELGLMVNLGLGMSIVIVAVVEVEMRRVAGCSMRPIAVASLLEA